LIAIKAEAEDRLGRGADCEALKALTRIEVHEGNPDNVLIVEDCVTLGGSYIGESSMSGKTVS
jgi:hypothetical protein